MDFMSYCTSLLRASFRNNRKFTLRIKLRMTLIVILPPKERGYRKRTLRKSKTQKTKFRWYNNSDKSY